MKTELKFNRPKDKEDARRLLMDLEDQVGVITEMNDEKYTVRPYKPKIRALLIEAEELNDDQAHRLGKLEQQEKVSAQCNRTAVEAVEALAAKHEAHVKAIQSELNDTSDTYAPDNMPYDVADLHERIGIILNRSGE